jgi:hypothetical protein
MEIWIMLGVNSMLLAISSFFIKQWINGVKIGESENKNDFNNYKLSNDKAISSIRAELGKRKGETELLRKDLELLSSETRKNFEGVNIHMNYQKTALDEIKQAISDSSKNEVAAISELVKMLKDDK